MTNLGCTAEPCPLLLNSTCVFYTGANLLYTGITTNNNLQTALEKIDLKFKDASIGYIFNDGVIQVSPGDPVTLGGIFTQDVTISNGPYNFLITNNLEAGAHVTTGGSSSQFVKGDGSLDGSSYQPSGSYITNLTGDGFANGPGVATFTLDNVNPTTGVFGSATRVPIITTNSKGLITNITTTLISIPSGVLTFTGDVSGSGFTGSTTTLTLSTVNVDTYGVDTPLKFSVNAKGLVTSASPITSYDILTLIGYTPVPESRTLTINGVTYDLTADRSWTISIFPSQTGNNGKYLQTDGTSVSWQPITINPGTVTDVSVINGTGINASVAFSTSTPTITITNTAPDQTVVLNDGTGISVTGTYPNFTIANTAQPAANTVTGIGTQNYLSKWAGVPSTLTDSIVYDNGSGVMVNTTTYNSYKFDVNGSARVQTNLVVGPVNAILVDTNYGIRVNTPMSGAATTFGVFADGEIQSDSTAGAQYFRTSAKTAATIFTVQDLHHFLASQGTFGAGSVVTNQWGFRVLSNMIGGATSNRAFSGELPLDGVKNWNLYMSGTALNYLAGNLLIGSSSNDGVNKLQVTGNIKVTGINNTTMFRVDDSTSNIRISSASNILAPRAQLIGSYGASDKFLFETYPGNNSYINNGNFLIGASSTADSTNKLQVTGSVIASQYRLSALNTAPATATSAGTLGEIRIDANFIYICVATNTWKRSAISTW